MDPFKTRETPEAKIQREIIAYLKQRDWLVKVTHGNAYQSGFPDLYATHPRWMQRWIEVKNPEAFSFTRAQIIDYPLMIANGSPIWIMGAATDEEYEKLFKPCNFMEYFTCFHDGCRNLVAWRAGRRK
jgi:hypothetical protein